MDLLLAACEGVGLALAAGAFSGAAGRDGAIGNLLLTAALIGGAALFGLALSSEDHPAWPGWAAGVVLAGFAYVAVRGLASGAATRADGGGFTSALIALAALALAGTSILFGPIGLAALAGVIWLYLGRRRQAARKYEGLRTLR